MKLSRWQVVVVYVVSVAVLAAGLVRIAQVWRDRDGGPSKPPAPATLAPMPFPAGLTPQGSGSRTSIGAPLPLTVHALGTAPIERVVLRDGARAVAVRTPDEPAAQVAIDFPPLAVGPHLLHAEVVATDGAVAATAPLPVTVDPGVGTDPLPVTVTTDRGESAEDVAERLGVAVDDLTVTVTDPGSGDPAAGPPPPGEPLAPGQVVTVRVAPDRGLAALDAAEPVVVGPGALAGSSSLPVPDVEVTGDCEVVVTHHDAPGDGGSLAQQTAGTAGWAVVQGTGPISLTPGTHVFRYVGDELSPPVSVVAPAGCAATAGWTGDVSISNGILSTSFAGTGYLLLGQEDDTWTRIPAEGRSLRIEPGLSIAGALPAFGGRSLDVQVWTFVGDTTKQVAAGRLEVGDGVAIADVVGQPAALDLGLTTYGDLLDKRFTVDGEPWDLTWTSASAAATTVRWQVTTAPQTDPLGRVDPPGLLATGTATGEPNDAGGAGGRFTVDLGAIPTTATVSGAVTTSLGPMALGTPPVVTGADLAGRTPLVLSPTTTSGAAAGLTPVPSPGDLVYVRILAEPSVGGTVAVSRDIPLPLPRPEGPGDSIRMRVTHAELDAGRAPNPDLAGCVQVDVPWPEPKPGAFSEQSPEFEAAATATGNPFGADVLAAFYPVDGVYCPHDWPPPQRCSGFLCDLYYGAVDGLTALWELAALYWDLAATFYNTIVDSVVETIGRMNLFCELFDGDSAEQSCYSASTMIAGLAASAALSLLGLPPRLPSSDVVAGLAEGEVGALIAELLQSIGVPCQELAANPDAVDAIAALAGELGVSEAEVGAQIAKDPCTALANLLVDAAIGTVKASASTGVAAASGMPYDPSVKGVYLTPATEGVPQPAVLTATLAPVKADADLSGFGACQLAVHAPSVQPSQQGIAPIYQAPTPYRWSKLVVGPSLTGSIAIRPDGNDADLAADLAQLGTLTVELSALQPTGCTIDPATATDALDPPLARPPNGG